MEPVQLIQSIEQVGCFLQAEGENVRIFNSNRLPDYLINELRTNKCSVLKIMDRDDKAKMAGFIIALPGELYTSTLSKVSVVYIERIGNQWQVWREMYQSNKEKAVSCKHIFTSGTFELVLLKAKSYFDYIGRIKEGSN
ncbi:hypothetical protein [Neobacillus massiliamazoniensis]|uniref:Uncharacterized protein n=1 Tax=Neobacillus massiliamazoniensis TaxID=1499688 RepID=A0A0U1NZL0_9BACI|nr:hypothetical protein [Neobacillus massiliamazoniensis]CRK83427.1 hypothetical protein BN000_03395 [Neobacillus massiliamazoniensis]